jgi:diguanylate cyclase
VEQLDTLTQYIAEHSEAETQRCTSTDALDLQITGEVRAIGESVATGTDLEQIRRQLRERLDSIGRHLQGFHEREEERRRLARERTAQMRARMEEMESEAKSLQESLSEKKRQSLLDPLTRIRNRLGWDERIADELERWRRFGQPACVLAWDIDRFKSINDSYGHRAGDRVLVAVAETLAAGIRGTDCVARYGGEEFVMLLPATPLAEGLRVAEQLRAAVAGIGFHFRGAPVSVTMSGGITQLREGDDANSAFDRADKAMYIAKESGRNRVASG